MGQCIQCHRSMTYVANGCDTDIKACVKVNKIEVFEEGQEIRLKAGIAPATAGVALNNHQKRNFVTQDPGFAIIRPGRHLGFAVFGADEVFVTIKIGLATPYADFQVHKNRNVILAKDGSLRNAKKKKIWIDISGENHKMKTSAVSRKRKSAVGRPEGLMESHFPADGGPRTSAGVEPATSRTDDTEAICRNKGKERTGRWSAGAMSQPRGGVFGVMNFGDYSRTEKDGEKHYHGGDPDKIVAEVFNAEGAKFTDRGERNKVYYRDDSTGGHSNVPQGSRLGESRISLTVRVESDRTTVRLTLSDCSTVKAVVNAVREKTGAEVQLRMVLDDGRNRILDEKKTLQAENIANGCVLYADCLVTVGAQTGDMKKGAAN